MLSRVVRTVSEVAAPQVVVAAVGQELPPLPPHVELVRDDREGIGPMLGLAAGLAALQGRVEAAFVTSCDVPLLRSEFIRRLISLLGESTICVPFVGGFYHPLAAVYRLDVLQTVRRSLATSRLSPVSLIELVATRIAEEKELSEVDPTFQSLRNLNSPADYEAALREQ